MHKSNSSNKRLEQTYPMIHGPLVTSLLSSDQESQLSKVKDRFNVSFAPQGGISDGWAGQRAQHIAQDPLRKIYYVYGAVRTHDLPLTSKRVNHSTTTPMALVLQSLQREWPNITSLTSGSNMQNNKCHHSPHLQLLSHTNHHKRHGSVESIPQHFHTNPSTIEHTAASVTGPQGGHFKQYHLQQPTTKKNSNKTAMSIKRLTQYIDFLQ